MSIGIHDWQATTTNLLSPQGFETLGFSTPFTDGTPTVLTQIQTFNGPDWAITRTDAITGSGFQLTMQEEEELNGGGHASETIGWLAIDQGSADDGDTLLEAAHHRGHHPGVARSEMALPPLSSTDSNPARTPVSCPLRIQPGAPLELRAPEASPLISAIAPGDRCHLNGLAVSEDGKATAYVTALAPCDVERGWRERKRDGGCLIDLRSGASGSTPAAPTRSASIAPTWATRSPGSG